MDGWNWHFFVADRNGNCASISFILGQPVIHTGDNMPIPVLCNAPYEDEMERLKYFQGFGGSYFTSFDNGLVPRFVLTASLLRKYKISKPAVDYSFRILKQMEGVEPSKWSVVCDPIERKVHFKTDQSPEIKHFALDEFDFSNQTSVKSLNIDFKKAGDATRSFTDHTTNENRKQIEKLLTSWWNPDDMPEGWVDMPTLINRFASHYGPPFMQNTWDFQGIWKGTALISNGEPYPDKTYWEVTIRCEDGRVSGEIIDTSGYLNKETLENFALVDRRLSFTFRKRESHIICKVESYLENDKMLGTYFLYKMRYGEPGRISLRKK